MALSPNSFSPAQKAAALALALSITTGLVETWEGKTNAVIIPIPGDKPTVCYGHTGPDVKMGQPRRTDAECKRLLKVDLETHGQGLLMCLRADVPTPLLGGFWSYTVNVGVKKACGSTAVRLANASDFKGACAELSRWVYANGRYVKGVANRRADERRVCERYARV